MKLTTAAGKVNNLRIDTTKEYILEPTEGVTTCRVYKTVPAKYIVSVDAFNEVGTQCHVLELTPQLKRRVHA